MRQTLFRIPFDYQISAFGTKIPLFGGGIVLALWILGWGWQLYRHVRRSGFDADFFGQLTLGSLIGVAIYKIPGWLPSAPVYGYGSMLLLGFLVAGWFASLRAKREGMDPELIWDAAMWVFIPGIVGARAFFIVQNRQQFFEGKQGLDVIKAIFNLPEGGLVLYGGVILGGVSYYLFCLKRKISPLALADVITPAIFIGILFGRLGCFLNGCCYGDPCPYPWAVSFPPGSAAYLSEVDRGHIGPDAAHTRLLHPTQLYSAIDGLVLALLTWNYYPFRRRDGEVLLLGWLCYPVTRFCIEFLRGDEPGQFGTRFTISQWVSIVLFATGLIYWYFLSRRPRRLPAPRGALAKDVGQVRSLSAT